MFSCNISLVFLKLTVIKQLQLIYGQMVMRASKAFLSLFLLSLFLSASAIGQTTSTAKLEKELIGSWIVKVEGADRDRGMIISDVLKKAEDVYSLDAKFGWVSSEQQVSFAEISQIGKELKLSLTAKSGAKVFATQVQDGSFVGNFVSNDGRSVPTTIKKVSETELQAVRTPREITAFLESTYGIVFKPSDEQKPLWSCPAGRITSPSGNITRSWVCARPDPSFSRTIAWRDSDERAQVVENDTFIIMGGARSRWVGEPGCTESAYPAGAGKIQGRIRDCFLPLQNGNFFVSFYHFKHRNSNLTFSVRNASPVGSTYKVKEVLREWIGELQFLD